jgi:hypothetical protein
MHVYFLHVLAHVPLYRLKLLLEDSEDRLIFIYLLQGTTADLLLLPDLAIILIVDLANYLLPLLLDVHLYFCKFALNLCSLISDSTYLTLQSRQNIVTGFEILFGFGDHFVA